MASLHDRLDRVESELLEAVAAIEPERMERLGRERDAILRGAAADLDAFGLRALIARDAEFGARVLAHRARVSEDIEALRTGRKAARAYVETACG